MTDPLAAAVGALFRPKGEPKLMLIVPSVDAITELSIDNGTPFAKMAGGGGYRCTMALGSNRYVAFRVGSDEALNTRAIPVVALLANGLHLDLEGAVAFGGLTPDDAMAAIRVIADA